MKPLCINFSPEFLLKISQYFEYKVYKPNEVLYDINQYDDFNIFFIEKGKVEL
jgi:CRP-like cAMP-binding protein